MLDLIGGETAKRSFAVVKKGGVMVSTVGAANAELAARAGIRGVNMVQKRSAADLSELAGFVERGDVKPRMGEVFPLERAAPDASEEGRAKGKILLMVGQAMDCGWVCPRSLCGTRSSNGFSSLPGAGACIALLLASVMRLDTQQRIASGLFSTLLPICAHTLYPRTLNICRHPHLRRLSKATQ